MDNLSCKFINIEDLINVLKKQNSVLGIVEYGSRTYTNMREGGDYDLTVIVKDGILKSINGVHFYIKDIPIDCMIKPISDFYGNPINIFDYVHLDCRILYDKNGGCKKALDNIKETWKTFPPINDIERSKIRFKFSHGFYKLNALKQKKDYKIPERALYYNDLISYLISHTLELYGKSKNLPDGKKKLYIEYMKDNDFKLFEKYLEYIDHNDIMDKYRDLCEICDTVLAPFGGFWSKDEFIYHGRNQSGIYPKDEVKYINNLLFVKKK